MGKTFNKSLVIAFIFIVSLFVFFGWYNKASASTAHPSIQFRDGNATWSDGYRPQTHAEDVDPTIKKKWESGDSTGFVEGSKYPRSLYAPDKGNRLGYDVYIGNTDDPNKQGIRIEKHGGKDLMMYKILCKAFC